MGDIFFHIGYPKSASTTLQKQLFNKHSQVVNLGLYPTKNIGSDSEDIDENSLYIKDSRVKNFYDILLKNDEISYKNSNVSALLDKLLQEYANNEDKSIVFSEERATSVFYTHQDIGVKAKRIKELMPNAKIIIVIRNQIDAMTSMYADFPFDPRSFSIGEPVDIDTWVDLVLEGEFIYYKEMLDYASVIEYYEKLFGKENICILPFEQLKNEKKVFSDSLSSFMNINQIETYNLLNQKHENKRVSHRFNIARSLKKRFFANISFKSILGDKVLEAIMAYLKKGKSKQYKMNKKSVDKVLSYYDKSNATILKKYDISMYTKDKK